MLRNKFLNQQFLVVRTLFNELNFGWLSQLRICWDRLKHQIKFGLSNEKSYGQHLCLPGPSINRILLSKHAGIASPDGAYWFVLHPSESHLMLNSPLCVIFLLNHAVGLKKIVDWGVPISGNFQVARGPLDHWSRVKLPLIKCFSGSVDPAGLLLRRSRRGVGWSGLAWFYPLVMSK